MISIENVMAETLKLPKDSLGEHTTMQNTPQWDSLKHMELILSIEKAAGIELTGDEIADMTSLTAIKTTLQRHGI